MSARIVRVGDLGTAATPMCPSGLVLLDGRRLDARADGEAIPAGASVVVLRGDPTGYVVRRVGPDHPMPQLPNAGAEIVTPEFARNAADVRRADARDEAEREREWRAAGRTRMRVAVLAGWLGSATLVDTLDPMRYPIPRSIGVAILGILVGAITTRHVRRNGKLFRWSAAAANTAVVAGFVGAGVGFWTQYGSYNPFLQVGGTWLGGLVGYWAGWWVATRLDVVFGGPDGA